MYLKSIEIQGFKSFANKIVFRFHNGITGIVGPNGSGKSNVADAVRWVLGEQRVKQLRGSSMQDVIFSGTETRKPLSYAYVSITLDNGDHQLPIDYNEVTVARRIYRSGESEYLINGTPCRLKDIHELFYDTGIGKEGYSIIGQGQIDKILSGKPEERRELFDEAAGIVKFKRRKAATQSKLENEKQNLVRVNDILSELKKQVEPLEKQSETAKAYLKKREQLKKLDINVFLLENHRIKEELRSVEEKYQIASSNLQETSEQYQQIKEEYEQIRIEIEKLEKTIECSRKMVSDTSLLCGKMEGEINVLKEQIHSAKGSETHFNNRRIVLEKEIASKNTDKEGIFADKKETDIQVQEIIQTANNLKSHLMEIQERIILLNHNIEDGNNKIIRELNRRATIKSKLGRFDTMMEQVKIRRAELNSKLLRAKSDEAAREETLKKLEAVFEAVSQELSVMLQKKTVVEQELDTIRKELTEKDKQVREIQNTYHQEKSRLEALTNLTERYEGYGGSIRKVMEQKEKEKGILGVVADIIKVEKKYETAMETALGGNLQNIVTDKEETAKKMIQYLKENRLGRATFLPLTSITEPQEFRSQEALKEKGVIGLADTLVHTEEKYHNIAKSLLGRILVVDNVDNAVKIAKKFRYSIRMVTLEGELLVPGGAISGGAFKNNSNLLGRRREIRELEQKIQQLSISIQEKNTDMEKIRENRNQLRMDLESLKADIQRKSIEQNTARINISQSRERMEEEMAGATGLKLEERQIQNKIFEIKDSKRIIQQDLADSETLEKDTKEQMVLCQKELEQRRTDETEAAAKVTEWDLKVEKMLQAQTFKQANIDRIDAEILHCQMELEEIFTALAENARLAEQKEKDIKELKKTIADSLRIQQETEESLKTDILQKEQLAEKQKNFFTSREELSLRMSSLDREVYRLNAQKEKLENSIESQINYMWDEYEITLSEAMATREETMTDLTSMKREIVSLKDQIKKLGDVNVNAIEDYRNLMERYTFLNNQHNDLVEAQKTLEGIIKELDNAMRKQFTEKFAEINKEFDKAFKQMFGGGKGTLELTEGEDILEAGIRIIAHPPGKKLQNMMQLSGGEKALSAIALLFAIQNLKPSPFCLLDEIEAALDESNVGRFAKYLHKLTKHTQFIVITHRRGTMEQVDRLYGITMQEKGVSTLVSVNLIDKELDD